MARSAIAYVIQRGQRYYTGSGWTRSDRRARVYHSLGLAKKLARSVAASSESWHPHSRYRGATVREVKLEADHPDYERAIARAIIREFSPGLTAQTDE